MTTIRAVRPAPARLSARGGLILGICAMLLGALLVYKPAASALVIVIFLGATWFVSGVVDMLSLFLGQDRPVLTVFSAWLGILAGLLVLSQPFVSTLAVSESYVFVLAAVGLLMGGLRLVQGLLGGGLATILWGAITSVLGGWLLLDAVVAVPVIPNAFGVVALYGGALMIVVAMMAHR